MALIIVQCDNSLCEVFEQHEREEEGQKLIAFSSFLGRKKERKGVTFPRHMRSPNEHDPEVTKYDTIKVEGSVFFFWSEVCGSIHDARFVRPKAC